MRSQTTLAVLLAGSACTILFVAAWLAASALPVQDLSQYWAAAHLVRENPYSFQLVEAFERSSGIATLSPPLVIKNPPWAILFILPLGLFGYRTAFAAWSVFSVAVVAGCARASWDLLKPSPSLAPLLMPILFGPTIVLLLLGQWTILVLLGITMFLVLVQHRRDWSAGASLLLVAGKPHIALLFLLAVVLWTVRFRRWAVIYSAVLALAASCFATLALNPHIFTQFLGRTRQVVDETIPYPNIGGALYMVSGHHTLALLPQVAGVLWLLIYWVRHGNTWDWKSDGMLVLLVSVACSYYSYPYDEVVVLPALLTAFATGNRKIFLVCFVAINLGYAVYLFQIAGKFGFSYMFLWWTATGWLVTYLATMGLQREERAQLAVRN